METKDAPSLGLGQCLVCGSGELGPFVKLGRRPLGTITSRARMDDLVWTGNFDVNCCRACSHVQLADAVCPDVLYGNDYGRLESFIADAHLKALGKRIAAYIGASSGVVLEVGCGAGALLEEVAQASDKVKPVGIDAAKNCIEACEKRGIDAMRGFFDRELADAFLSRFGSARVMVARHVIEHVTDPLSFVKQLASVGEKESLLIVEVPQFEWAERMGDFTSFTEQHLSYFSYSSLTRLLEAAGLKVESIESVPNAWSDAWLAVCRIGGGLGASESAYHPRSENFVLAMDRVREKVTSMGMARPIGLFGNFCRTTNMVNFLELRDEFFAGVFDDGASGDDTVLYGTRVPVSKGSALDEDGPDCCVIAAINHEKSIELNHSRYTDRGGRFMRLTELFGI